MKVKVPIGLVVIFCFAIITHSASPGFGDAGLSVSWMPPADSEMNVAEKAALRKTRILLEKEFASLPAIAFRPEPAVSDARLKEIRHLLLTTGEAGADVTREVMSAMAPAKVGVYPILQDVGAAVEVTLAAIDFTDFRQIHVVKLTIVKEKELQAGIKELADKISKWARSR